MKGLETLFGYKYNPDFKSLINEGAIILDVRTKAEFDTGHIDTSINISHEQLEKYISTLDKSKAIITCCETGMRSESAKRTLKSYGFERVYNAGNWGNLKKYFDEKN